MTRNTRDEDDSKGALEQDSRNQKTNTSMAGQNPHRNQDPLLKSHDSDFPEPGQNEEHTGEPANHNQLGDDSGCNPEGVEPAPGSR